MKITDDGGVGCVTKVPHGGVLFVRGDMLFVIMQLYVENCGYQSGEVIVCSIVTLMVCHEAW